MVKELFIILYQATYLILLQYPKLLDMFSLIRDNINSYI